MTIRRFLILALFLFAGIQTLQAQIQVTMSLPRQNYLAYEPMIATVQVSNLTGHDITLHDSGIQQWFGFQVSDPLGNNRVAPRDPNYQLPPLNIPAGTAVKRAVNLVSLYPVTEFGSYRAQANVYSAELNRYFRSQPVFFSVTDGTLVWQQTVGVPDGQKGAGTYRQISVLKFDDGKHPYAYVRIADKSSGTIFCVYRVGLYLQKPTIKLDSQNTIYVLQLVGPKTYKFTHIGLNGHLIAQNTYYATKSYPNLVKSPDGDVGIVGGVVKNPTTTLTSKKSLPSLSARPANMPKF